MIGITLRYSYSLLGALLEARQGNIEVAKQVFKYLMAQVWDHT